MPTMTLSAPQMSQEFLVGIVVTLAATIFFIDVTLPLGVAGGVPYVTVVLVTLWLQGTRATLGMAIMCTCLTILGAFWSPPGGELWKVVANRCLTAYAIWVTAVLTIRHKKSMTTLVEERSLLRQIIDLIPQFIILQSPSGQVLLTNRATETALGITPENASVSDLSSLWTSTATGSRHEKVNEQVLTTLTSQQILNEQVSTVDQGVRTMDFLKLPCKVSQKPVVLSIGVDQTDQKAMKETLQLTQRVFDSSQDFIAVLDAQYRYRRVNPAYERAYGIAQDQISGRMVSELFGKDVFYETIKPKLETCLTGKDVHYENWFTFPNLGVRYISVSYFPLRTDASAIEGVIVVARDLTERIQAQDEIKKSEKRYRDLFESAPLAYFSVTFDGHLHAVNTRAVDLLGYSKEELIGRSVLELYAHTEHGRKKAIGLQQIAQGGTELEGEELQMLRKDGSIVWVSLTVRLIRDSDGQIIERRGIVKDISERKCRENELTEKQQRLQLMNGIMSHINAGMTTEAIIEQTIKELRVMCPFYRVVYATITENGVLEVLCSNEPEEMLILKGTKVDLTVAPDYLARLRDHQPVLVSDVTKDLRVAPLADLMLSGQTRAICDIPLVHSGQLLGLLCLDSSEPHHWTEFEITTLGEVAELVALVIRDSQIQARRREAEAALQVSEQRLTMALEATNAGIWEWQVQTGEVLFQDSWLRSLGYTRSQVQNNVNFWESIVHPEDMPKVRESLQRHFSGQQSTYECINRLRTASGEWRWNLDRGRVVEWTRDRRPLRMLGTDTDITEYRTMELSLQESEARLQAILDNSPGLIFLKDLNGRYLHVNRQFKQVFDLKGEEVIGKSDDEIFSPDQALQFKSHDRQVMEHETLLEFEEVAMHDDGPHTSIVHKFPLCNEKGQVFAVGGLTTDITERKKAEERTRESERFAYSTMNALSAHICVINDVGTIVAVNGRWNDFAEANEGKVERLGVGANYLSICDTAAQKGSQDAQHVGCGIRSVISKQAEEFFYDYECPSSMEPRWFTCRATRFPDPGPIRIVIAHEDITDLKLAQATLQKRIEEVHDLYNNAPCGYHSLDGDGCFVEVNDTELRWLGYSRQEILNGVKFTDVLTPLSAITFKKNLAALKIPGRVSNLQVELVRKDGSTLPILLDSLVVTDEQGQFVQTRSSLLDNTERQHLEEEFRKYAEGLQEEVSRRTIQIQNLEQRRMQIEKLAVLAQISAGVAHEINNPLASISQAMLLVKQAVDPAHPHFEYIARIDECIGRMARIVRNMYELYRPHKSTLSQQDLVPVVRTAVDIMRLAAEKRQISLRCRLPKRLVVPCVRSELVQVLCNLIQNALDASAPKQEVIVGMTRSQETVVLSITDRGVGIPADVASNMFEPFYTTKGTQEGQGMGMGLSVSKSLLEAMGGMLDFTTSEKHGSTFTISFPLR